MATLLDVLIQATLPPTETNPESLEDFIRRSLTNVQNQVRDRTEIAASQKALKTQREDDTWCY